MNKLIRVAVSNNIFWFIASLLIALMVWFIAKTEANPVEQRVFTRPINILVDEGMIITEVSSENARVFINAQESTLAILQLDDINVSVDLQGQAAGSYTIPLNVQIARPASSDTQPAQINVQIESRVSQQVPVEINVLAPPVNYAADTPNQDIFQALVSGASADVTQVSRVVGDFDLSIQQTAALVERTLALYAEDANGNRIEDVTIEPASLLVSVNVTQRDDVQTFTVRPDIDFNSLPENFEFNDVDYEPNFIIINGNPDLLDSLGDTIDTLPISLEGQTGNFTIEVALDLPDDPSLVILSEESVVTVDVFISEEDSTVSFENIPIRIIGDSENSNLAITVNPTSLSAVITGPISVIETIEAADVQAIVDVNGLDEGTHTIVPQIEIAQGQISLDPSNITLIPLEVIVIIPSSEPELTEVPAVTPQADAD